MQFTHEIKETVLGRSHFARRKTWPDGHELVCFDTWWQYDLQSGQAISRLTNADLNATDWEIVERKK